MRRRAEARVFFPWERRRGIVAALARARIRQLLCVALLLIVVWVVERREERAAAVRATRAGITQATKAISAYRADHGGACPRSLRELPLGGYVREVPLDAWGRSLRLVCPGRRDPRGFELVSDGPDGLPFGLDRVE